MVCLPRYILWGNTMWATFAHNFSHSSGGVKCLLSALWAEGEHLQTLLRLIVYLTAANNF